MINDHIGIIIFLLAVESFVLYVSSHPKFQKYFHFIPAVFWIYFLPMLASTFGLIDPKAPIYQTITTWVLPASLVLLLLSSDMRAILSLGRPAVVMMLAGSFGIMLGMPVVFGLFKSMVGKEMWSGFGALSGSWIGGSANMIAVKEAIGTPDAVFAPMVIVDTVVPYVWMGILIACSGLQNKFDHFIRADRKVLNDLGQRSVFPAGLPRQARDGERSRTTAAPDSFSSSALPAGEKKNSLRVTRGAFLLGIAIAGALIAKWIAAFLPIIPNILSNYAWTIIVASSLGIVLSFTSARSLEQAGASKIGYFLLYLVLTTIGAKASITNLNSAFILITAGFLVVMIHAVILLLAAKVMRSPMFLVAAASQANIGGVASAPVVAAVYQPGLASVGLLLAIFGNIIGTYLGIITAQLCRMVAG